MPLGLPKAIATRTFPIAQRLGITSRKTVGSFDEVLWFTGNLDYGYLSASVESVRKAIHDFRPELAKGVNRLLSEFGMREVESALKLFEWADKSFCLSIAELESIIKPDLYFCGTLKTVRSEKKASVRDACLITYKILIYGLFYYKIQ